MEAGERIGRYEIEALLGRGGMGAVYRVYDPATNRHVALKVLAPGAPEEDRRRFRREVEIQGNVHHPHLMPIYDSGVLGTTRWYTMEFLERPLDLKEVVDLRRPGAPEPPASLRPLTALEGILRLVLVPVCEAIHHANVREGVLHRDLKPANVLVDRNGLRPYVIDFGVGSVLERTNDRLAHLPREVPVAGSGKIRVTGTLGWMPPEQARGETDRRGDVWALGALLRFCATGEPPYAPASRSGVGVADRVAGLRLLVEQAERAGNARELAEFREKLREVESTGDRSTEDLARDVLSARYVAMATSVDRGLAAIVRKAMAQDPADRYRHALELKDEIVGWLDRRPLRAVLETTGTTRGTLYRGRLLLRRNLRAVVVTALLALLGGAAALGFLGSRGDDEALERAVLLRRLRDEALTAESEGDVARARRAARELLALDPRQAEAFEILDRLVHLQRAEGILDEARRLAREADERYRAKDDAGGDASLSRLRFVLDEMASVSRGTSADRAEEEADLRRRARGELPFTASAPADGCRFSLVPVAPHGGPVRWDAERPTSSTVPRGAWSLRARRETGEVFGPFDATGADHGVTVICPVDPATLDAGTLYVGGGRARGPLGPADVAPLLWDRREATEERYARFLDALPPDERRRRVPRVAGALGTPDRPLWTEKDGRHEPPTGAGRRPVEAISLHDARAFARFEGKRLPTAAEWAWAASGPDGRLTAAGSLADVLALGLRSGTGGAAGDVEAVPGDRSPFGLSDLAGNVAEWTSTLASFRGLTGWFVMGGGYASDPTSAVVTRADPRPGWVPAEGVGVRFVRDAAPP